MNAFILSIGDELVLGQTVDTNSAWLSQQLAAVGCAVVAHLTVPDDQQAIEKAIRDAFGQCQLLLISGGIGPTQDDLTRQAIARVLDQPLEMNPQWLTQLEAFFRERRRPMPESNKIQAMIPRGAAMIPNAAGTAAGISARIPSADLHLFAMPGVPKEMKRMFQQSVLPFVTEKNAGATIVSRTIHTIGLGESTVAEKLGSLMDRTRNPSVGTTVAGGVVSLRLNSRFPTRALAIEELEKISLLCRDALGDLIYGQDDQSIATVVAALLMRNPNHPLQFSTAESCTGGLLAKMLTDIPGSSRYFQRGWITYSNQAKTQLLQVPPELIAKYGAVSTPVVEAMANSARTQSGADFALAISGIAGPEGGTPEKPVGTVCIALASAAGVAARTFNFPGDREMVRDRAAKIALALLRFHLLGQPVPF